MFESLKEKFLRFFTVTMVVVILVGGLLFLWPKVERGKALRRQDAELSRQLEAKRAEIAKMKSFQQRIRTDRDFIEKIARQNNRVYPGELVYLFEENDEK